MRGGAGVRPLHSADRSMRRIGLLMTASLAASCRERAYQISPVGSHLQGAEEEIRTPAGIARRQPRKPNYAPRLLNHVLWRLSSVIGLDGHATCCKV